VGNTIDASWGGIFILVVWRLRGAVKNLIIIRFNRELIHGEKCFTFGEGFNLLPARTAE
jgi:hypothetical protein